MTSLVNINLSSGIPGVTAHAYAKALKNIELEKLRKDRGQQNIPRNFSTRRAAQEEKVSYSIDSAALQNDIARRYNLPGVAQNVRTKKVTSRSHSMDRICGCCKILNRRGSAVCESCGFFLSGPQQQTETLAQSRGLIPKPIKTDMLSQQDWEGIEKKLDSRGEAFCPICMEAFNRGHEVMLSCSHMFHRTCLQSFEKFLKAQDKVCPICRTNNYQKKITHKGSKAFQIVCAIKIQAWFRGYKTRLIYRIKLRSFYQQGHGQKSQRKKFYEQELCCYTNKISEETEVRNKEVNSVLCSMDQTLLESRQLDLLFDSMMMERRMYQLNDDNTVSYPFNNCSSVLDDVDWNSILLRALDRGLGECAICMVGNGGLRRTTLLSCSHFFHDQCIRNFEFFSIASDSTLCQEIQQQYACPVCRSVYQRRTLSTNCQHFSDALAMDIV